jgi:hypothetical protein
VKIFHFGFEYCTSQIKDSEGYGTMKFHCSLPLASFLSKFGNSIMRSKEQVQFTFSFLALALGKLFKLSQLQISHLSSKNDNGVSIQREFENYPR